MEGLPNSGLTRKGIMRVHKKYTTTRANMVIDHRLYMQLKDCFDTMSTGFSSSLFHTPYVIGLIIVKTLVCILISISFEIYSKPWIIYSRTSTRTCVLFDERVITVSFMNLRLIKDCYKIFDTKSKFKVFFL